MSEYTTTTEPETANPPAPAGWETAPTSTEDNPPEAPAVSPPAEVAHARLLLLPPALAGLAKCTGDTARYPFGGVRVDALEGNRYRAEATNGKVLARVEGESDSPDDYPSWPELAGAPNGAAWNIVPAKDWTAAFRGVPKQPKRGGKPILSNLAVVLGAEVVTLASTDLQTRSLQQPAAIEGRWPATDQVFPKGAPLAEVKLDALLLAELLRVAAAFAPECSNNSVTLTVYPPDKRGEFTGPVKLSTKGGPQTFTGLVMPLS